MGRNLRLVVAALPCLAGSLLLGEQVWLGAKARLAERLIDRAWSSHLADGAIHRPWSWADIHPLARIAVPRLGIERTVLSGASGSSLAFGPGHVDGSAPPGGPGSSMIAGHRDGAFAFLAELEVGDAIEVETRSGVERFEVEEIAVITMWDADVLLGADRRLLLVTCYPFGGLGRTPWRYLVVCKPLTRPLRPAGGGGTGRGRSRGSRRPGGAGASRPRTRR